MLSSSLVSTLRNPILPKVIQKRKVVGLDDDYDGQFEAKLAIPAKKPCKSSTYDPDQNYIYDARQYFDPKKYRKIVVNRIKKHEKIAKSKEQSQSIRDYSQNSQSYEYDAYNYTHQNRFKFKSRHDEVNYGRGGHCLNYNPSTYRSVSRNSNRGNYGRIDGSRIYDGFSYDRGGRSSNFSPRADCSDHSMIDISISDETKHAKVDRHHRKHKSHKSKHKKHKSERISKRKEADPKGCTTSRHSKTKKDKNLKQKIDKDKSERKKEKRTTNSESKLRRNKRKNSAVMNNKDLEVGKSECVEKNAWTDDENTGSPELHIRNSSVLRDNSGFSRALSGYNSSEVNGDNCVRDEMMYVNGDDRMYQDVYRSNASSPDDDRNSCDDVNTGSCSESYYGSDVNEHVSGYEKDNRDDVSYCGSDRQSNISYRGSDHESYEGGCHASVSCCGSDHPDNVSHCTSDHLSYEGDRREDASFCGSERVDEAEIRSYASDKSDTEF